MRPSTTFLLIAIPLLLTPACRGDRTGTGPNSTQPPAALEVSLPAAVVAGQPFALEVKALDAAGTPNDRWAGTVALSASAGSLTPATMQLSGGRGTVQATLSGHAGAAEITATLGDVRASREASVLSGEPAVRLEIVPSTFLLPAAGAAQRLEARAFDAQNRPTTAEVTWISSRPDVVGVAADGTATAGAALGSAQVTARAGSLTSMPALGLAARPAAGAVLVPDSLVVGEVTAIDPADEYDVGWRYRVRLRGLAVEPGQILLGTGEQPVAGRVVSVAPLGAEMEVTLALIPLPELVPELRIDETLPMVEASEVEVEANAVGYTRSSPPFRASFTAAADKELQVGPFTCTVKGNLPSLDLPNPKLEITPSVGMKLLYATPGGGLETLAVVGSLKSDFGYKPVLKAGIDGEATCEHRIRTLILPISGWFSFFFGAKMPVGAGFALDGKLEIAEVGFDVKANASATVELGMSCPGSGGDCTGLNTFETTRDGSFGFISPNATEQFRVELGAHGYLWAALTLGSPLSQSLQFEVLKARGGLKQSVDLGTAHRQVKETDYASDFKLAFLADAGAGGDLEKTIKKLGRLLGLDLKLNLTFLDIDEALAESPKGTFTIEPSRVAPGDGTTLGEMATFRVHLDPITYLGLPSVDRVRFYWRKDDGNSGFTLANGRPACTSVAAAVGQTVFECQTDFLEEHRGAQTFYALADARLFGVPLPVSLEIATDAGASVLVSDQHEPPEQTIAFTFNNDLDGWAEGTTSNGWGAVTWLSRRGGVVKLDGVGGPGDPNAWIYKTIEIPRGATRLRFETSAHNRDGADALLRVRVVDANQASHTVLDWENLTGTEGQYLWTDRSVSIAAFAGQTVTVYFEQADNGPGRHEQRYLDTIIID
ncbi:MAG: hypothetical protein H0X65_08765 [Gemmatimonadetes bacterium]|nr:hypothetical protein [Gemmatimonadota bacterium]